MTTSLGKVSQSMNDLLLWPVYQQAVHVCGAPAKLPRESLAESSQFRHAGVSLARIRRLLDWIIPLVAVIPKRMCELRLVHLMHQLLNFIGPHWRTCN